MSRIGTGFRKWSFSRPRFLVVTSPASPSTFRCFITPKRVIGSRRSSAPSVCPSCSNSSSSRLRRVGSARALKTTSMPPIICDLLVTCQAGLPCGCEDGCMVEVRTAHTADLDAATLEVARALVYAVFQTDMSEHDWEHALGGVHALAWEGGELVGHASLVQRRLLHGGRALRAGYVEGGHRVISRSPSR